MAQQGFISNAQASVAEQSPCASPRTMAAVGIDEPTALDAVRAIVDSVLPDVLKDGDVIVHTTLDLWIAARRSRRRQASGCDHTRDDRFVVT
jgi:hypothetical protein